MISFAKNRAGTGVWLFGMVFAPLLVMSAALFVARQFSLHGAGWDYAGIALAVASGLYCLWHLPPSVSFLSRGWLVVLYVAAAAALLMLLSLFFISVVFGDSL